MEAKKIGPKFYADVNKTKPPEYSNYEDLEITWKIGDWGLGMGDWGLGPIPNPQSPIPNPQSPWFWSEK